jgi:hypothetical protein
MRKSPHAPQPARNEYRLFYEWYAGWRWEHHCAGLLVDESWHSFETREECVADANRHRSIAEEAVARVPANEASHRHEHEPAQLAA